MKLRGRTFAIFWDVHAWTGVITSLVVFVSFFLGPFALFRNEIDHWAEPPAFPAASREMPPIAPLLAQIGRDASFADIDRIDFDGGSGRLNVYWSRGGAFHDTFVDPTSGALEPAAGRIGTFLYEVHYLGPIPNGIYVAGLAAVVLLLVIVSGVVLHWKDIVRQWFQLRAARPLRVWSSDFHKVAGMLTLPFALLFAFTGAAFCLQESAITKVIDAVAFRGDAIAAARARGEPPSDAPAARIAAPLPDVDRIVAETRAAIAGFRPTSVAIEAPGDGRATIRIVGDGEAASSGAFGAFGAISVVVRASDGAIVDVQRPGHDAYAVWREWTTGLHYARYGGTPVKLAYAWLALVSAAVVITGTTVWLERRSPRRDHAGHRFLERITIGISGGLVVAASAALFACRAMPALHPARGVVEEAAFWGAWIGCAALPFAPFATCATSRPGNTARFLFALAGVIFAATVLLGLRARTDPAARAVDLGLVALAFACGIGAFAYRRRAPALTPPAPIAKRDA